MGICGAKSSKHNYKEGDQNGSRPSGQPQLHGSPGQGAVHKKPSAPLNSLNIELYLSKDEIKFLKLIFDDLSNRTEKFQKKNVIDIDIFSIFLPMSGLLGKRLFHIFNKQKNGFITVDEFLEGLADQCKCNEDKKILHLYNLYDIDATGSISEDVLVTMLFNYPKDQIQQITNVGIDLTKKVNQYESVVDFRKEKNVKTITDEVHDNKYLKDKESMDEDPNNTGKKIPHHSIGALHREGIISEKNAFVRNNVKKHTALSKKNITNNAQNIANIAATMNLKIKMYAQMIIQKYDSEHGVLDSKHFRAFVKDHKVILDQFLTMFREKIWAQTTDPLTGGDVLGYTLIKPSAIAVVTFKIINSKNSVKILQNAYVELRDHFLFVYKNAPGKANKSYELPTHLIFLDGLYIEHCQNNTPYGFDITHKNKCYGQYQLIFSLKDEFDKWNSFIPTQTKLLQDKYTISDQIIGRGRFSVVYKGFIKGLQNEKKGSVAIKVINKDSLKEEEEALLRNESKIMAILDHKYLAKHLETFETRNTIFLVIELVEDGDLFEYISNNEFLDEYDASMVFRQLAECVAYMHSVGVIHRDLKTENIMIKLDKEKHAIESIKLIDFGLARQLDAHDKVNEGCGTPGYLAPEMILGVPYDKSVDIFSMGVILFFLLRGELPFYSNTADIMIRRTIRNDYDISDFHWSNVSQDAKDLVTKLLVTEPEKRISLKEILQHKWITQREELKKLMGVNRNLNMKQLKW